MINFKIEGLKELEEVLVKIGDEFGGSDKVVSKVLKPAVREAIKPIHAMAVSMAPYDETNYTQTHLKTSIKMAVRQTNQRDHRSAFVNKNAVVSGLVYAKTDERRLAMEFGTATVAAKPFLRPALESNAARAVQIFSTYLAYKIPQVFKSKKV
jgi:HK97 gp10 family phage protein